MGGRGALVLMYHGVGDVAAPHAELRYTVSEPRFREHLQALSSFPVVSLAQMLSGQAPDGSVVLSFDDGEESVVSRVLPLLEARGFPGVLFVTTGWIGTPGYCDEEGLQRLASAGWEIGAHGMSHRFLTELDDEELAAELCGARTRLQEILGSPPQHLSLPGGRGDRRVRKVVRAAGFRSLCTSVVGRNERHADPFAVKRVGVRRGRGPAWLARLAAGDRRLLLELKARQELFDVAKRLLGNDRYEMLREAASRLLGLIRSYPSAESK